MITNDTEMCRCKRVGGTKSSFLLQPPFQRIAALNRKIVADAAINNMIILLITMLYLFNLMQIYKIKMK